MTRTGVRVPKEKVNSKPFQVLSHVMVRNLAFFGTLVPTGTCTGVKIHDGVLHKERWKKSATGGRWMGPAEGDRHWSSPGTLGVNHGDGMLATPPSFTTTTEDHGTFVHAASPRTIHRDHVYPRVIPSDELMTAVFGLECVDHITQWRRGEISGKR